MVAFRLASGGWWGGDPEKVLQAPVEQVMIALQYEKYKSDYEAVYVELNREKA